MSHIVNLYVPYPALAAGCQSLAVNRDYLYVFRIALRLAPPAVCLLIKGRFFSDFRQTVSTNSSPDRVTAFLLSAVLFS